MTPAPSLPPPVPGEALRLNGRAGTMTVHVAGQGPPLLLVHSVNAAAARRGIKPGIQRATALALAADLLLADRSPQRDAAALQAVHP